MYWLRQQKNLANQECYQANLPSSKSSFISFMGRIKRCVGKLEHKISLKLSAMLLLGGTGYHQLMRAIDVSNVIFHAVAWFLSLESQIH